MKIITPRQFNFDMLLKIPAEARGKGKHRAKDNATYKKLITAFDIETTRIVEIEQSVMYVWQWCFGDVCCIVGRTWEEFTMFCKCLKPYMAKQRLVVFVHNLSYEFQFLSGIYPFNKEEVFAIDSRKILKCNMFDFLEFRCSYLHSNMSLAEYTSKMGAKHVKLSREEFDYSKPRYPWTPLTDKEIDYCTYDVIGLVEAITNEMKHDGDNLYTFPLTSTGYVRRDAKTAMKRVSHTYVPRQLPNYHVYELCREAFRGGNTHASRFHAGHTLFKISSADRSSSYPDVLVNRKFPIDAFYEAGEMSFEQVLNLINVRKKAVLMRVRIYDLRLLDDLWPCPYLAKGRCRSIIGGYYDNGRIIEAEYLETTITDVDLRIILEEYDFSAMQPFDVAYARYGKLPPPFIDIINEYYRRKTVLKGNPEEELTYFRAKQKLNSLYGMCAQDPVKQSIDYIEHEFIEQTENPAELLEKHNRRAFLCYQWGVWVTAWARYELEEGIRLAGENFVYCDTDSVKYLCTIDWTEYNNRRIKASKKNGAHATDSKGIEHYMGVFEPDGCYEEFATLGAKKYCYREHGKLKITVAGVIKKKGGEELEIAGGIESFKPNFIFRDAGGLEAVYNDDPEVKEWSVDGHTLKITSNVVLRESEYTLGITEEYEQVLRDAELILTLNGL